MKKYLLTLLILPSAFVYVYLQHIDVEILKDVYVNRYKELDNSFRIITDSAAFIAFGIPVLLFLVGLISKNCFLRNSSYYLAVTTLSAAIVSTIIKRSYDRLRPYEVYSFIEKLTDGGKSSFPSGHTSDAFAIATSLSIIFPKWYVIVPAYIWAIAVGYSRMHLGVHYPTDVLAGAMVGACCACLCYLVNNKIKKAKNDRITK
jgi:membrane-associated phospholipid phosphatase